MPPDLVDVLMYSALNPAAIAAGYFLGRKADQVQKLALAPFVAGIAGMAFVWLMMRLGLFAPKIRLLVGVFVASGLFGVAWAWLGYVVKGWLDRS
ncbi:MAG: hypothetical protein R3D67_09440 [Hyphomicrobiaceae bacterium]